MATHHHVALAHLMNFPVALINCRSFSVQQSIKHFCLPTWSKLL